MDCRCRQSSTSLSVTQENCQSEPVKDDFKKGKKLCHSILIDLQ
jgi:hypothetical protein